MIVDTNLRQSALTDFLASHNISATRIREDFAARLATAENEETVSSNAAAPAVDDEDEDVAMNDDVPEETPNQIRKRKRAEKAAIDKIKSSKKYAKEKAARYGELGDDNDDDDGDGDDDDGLAFNMYAKAKIVPGQMNNCESCNKRFTVTPYTKEGPNGSLLCTKCGKVQEDAKKKEAKAKQAPVVRGKRSKVQSNIMDGHGSHGAKSLLDLCIERVAKSIDDIEDFGDLPPSLYDRLSMLLSKHRVLDSRTIDLFLHSGNDRVAVYDCGKLQTDDFIKIFQICPTITKIDLRQAGQFKDRVIDFILEREIPLRELRLDASNLITDAKWQQFFIKAGPRLESLSLSWLDFAMTNPTVEFLVLHCTKLKRLSLKRCFHLDDIALGHLARLQALEHLSLSLPTPTQPQSLTSLISAIGPSLRSLSLRTFCDADDTLLETIHQKCHHLQKLVISNNDRITDAAYTALFTSWTNPPLERATFTSCRETDAEAPARQEPEGQSEDTDNPTPDPTIGLSSNGFTALMTHSGQSLRKLSISSCRTISHSALFNVFDGINIYPSLSEIDLSFVGGVDTVVVAGIFKSCPKLSKLVAFGCFDVAGVQIPLGVALIGVPAAQESIVQEGVEEI